MGYNYTILTPEMQIMVYRFMYRKNITDPDPETPQPDSHLANLVMSPMKSFPKCANSIKKLYCSEIIPPCFPDEGPKLYTVCKPICKNIGDDCPELLTGSSNSKLIIFTHDFFPVVDIYEFQFARALAK